MEKTFDSNHPLFEDFDFGGAEGLEISLGVHEAFARELTGSGEVPCVVTPRLRGGGFGGTSGHPGFAVFLDQELLLEVGFDETAIWIARGASEAEVVDDGWPLCGECAAADGGPVTPYTGPKTYCGCCAEMIEENVLAAEEEARDEEEWYRQAAAEEEEARDDAAELQ